MSEGPGVIGRLFLGLVQFPTTRSFWWCLAAALLYVAAFPPLDLGVLGFVALWPWCRLVRELSGWRLVLAGYFTGALILGIGCFWIHETSPVNLVLMVLPESLYYGLFAWALRRVLVTRRVPAPLALPVVFVAMELGRSRFPLEGFPWLLLGYSQHSWSPLLQVSDLVGVMGVSALLAMCAGAVEHWWQRRGSGRGTLRPLLLGALVLLAAHLYGAWRLSSEFPSRPGPRMLLVQPNIPQELKDSSDQHRVLQRHQVLTRAGLEAAAQEVDLVTWSETMLPTGAAVPRNPGDEVWYEEGRGFTAADADQLERRLLADLSREYLEPHDVWLLAGAMTAEGDVREGEVGLYNSAILYDQSGQKRGLYDKTVLVPGGEYLPWLDLLPESARRSLRRAVREMAGFVPNLRAGAGAVVLPVPAGSGEAWLGPTICYEIAYPEYGRRVVAAGAEVLVNLSNEAWFPDSAEFAQYTAMAVFRATEVRRAVVRCANSGTSGLIDAHGRVTALEENGRRDGFAGTMVVQPQLLEVSTLYARWGDWLAWLAVGLTAVLLLPWGNRGAGAVTRDPSDGL